MNLSILRPQRLRPTDLALLVAIAAMAVRVAWPGIDASLWLDEQMIAMNIRDRDLAHLAGLLDHEQSAPLAWLWIERVLFTAFGPAEWVLRLQPFAFGLAAVVVAWWYGRRWLNPAGSTALVALIGFNYAAILYTSQLKHYSLDLFFAFLLIALARWVLEDPVSYRRYLWWWGAAAAGSWLSNGATLAAPGIALVLAIRLALVTSPAVEGGGRQADHARVRAWVKAALPGLVWLASFSAHYLLSLRAATANDYLNSFWSALGYPPEGGSALEILRWYANQIKYLFHNTVYLDVGLEPHLLAKSIFVVFALLFLAGLAVTFRRRAAFGWVLCAPLLTGLLLAQLRVVPLFGRLALWLMPAMLVAVAHAIDFRPERYRPVRWATLAAALLLLVPLVNSVRGVAKPPEFDDRAAIAWLRERHRPGDLTLFVATSGRAAEWYDTGKRLTPWLSVVDAPAGPQCDPSQLRKTVYGYSRVLVYAGARLAPYKETYSLLEAQLARLGTITERARFGTDGITYIAKLGEPVPLTGTTCLRLL